MTMTDVTRIFNCNGTSEFRMRGTETQYLQVSPIERPTGRSDITRTGAIHYSSGLVTAVINPFTTIQDLTAS